MVNNSVQIREMLSFEEFDFYFVQILKRRKDNPDMPRDMTVINMFYIESLGQFDGMIPHIIEQCNVENARAYISLNKRNYKHLAHHMLKRVVDVVASGQYKSLRNSFNSVTGEYHSDPIKTWIVDIDWVNVKTPENMIGKFTYYAIQDEVMRLQSETKNKPMLVLLPTKNGVHFITRPFNLQKFKEKYPSVDVHKDNMCILYCP